MQVEADDACLTCEATLTKINAFLEDALRSSCEGIMVKTLDVDAGYSPSKHSDKWLKVSNYATGLWSLCLRLKNQVLNLYYVLSLHFVGRVRLCGRIK